LKNSISILIYYWKRQTFLTNICYFRIALKILRSKPYWYSNFVTV